MSGVIQGFTRLQQHGITEAGSIFTIPPSEDFTDRTWSETDLVLGEIGLNLTDDRAFFRSLNGIVELQTSSITSALWVRDGEDIVAVENGLTSPLIYPNVLPPDDDVSDLGSSVLKWKDTWTNNIREVDTVEFNGGTPYKRVTINIGDWDMDATSAVSVNHGLSATEWKTIRAVHMIIRNDNDDTYYQPDFGTGGYIRFWGATAFTPTRVAAGQFDSTSFDSTSYNRGWLTFEYTPD